MSSSQSTSSSFKANLLNPSTERNRERLRKRVEEEKTKGSEMKKKEDEDKGKQNDRKSSSPVKTMRTPRGTATVTPTKEEGGSGRRVQKRRFSFAKGEETIKEKKELRGRSSSPTKEAKSSPKKKNEIEKKAKGSKGRPIGWRKEDKGKGYLHFVGLKKISPVKQGIIKKKKTERRIVNNIKKKYHREVSPCAVDDVKGVGIRKKGVKASPMKTRALQKKSEKEENSLIARCVLCRSKEGEMQCCAECNALYHLRKCCRYSEEAAHRIESGERKRWLCSRCTSCTLCNEYISDPLNVECAVCTMNYHGKCGEKAGNMTADSFICHGCIKETKNKEGEKEGKKGDEVGGKTGQRGRKPRIRGPLPKGWEYAEHPSEMNDVEEKRRIDERDALYDQLMEQITKSNNGNPNSPSKYGIISSSPQKLKKIALQCDKDLFESAKAALAAERKEKEEKEGSSTSMVREDEEVSISLIDSSPSSSHSSIDTRHQWIYVGSKKHKMKSIYKSPYPQEIQDSINVMICPFCLRANCDEDMFRIHEVECTWKCPPGNEIYRDTEKKFSFFEVDGADQKLYCRRVCQLGKLFISSKTLVDEVETFLFYILVEHTNDGCEFVGYFSKEKNPSKNNNLSCILTLPSAMRSGYGRLLIDLSYELSRVERKIGSPEHPLSDLGLLAYMGFWRSSILCYLRSLRGSQIASVKQISLATRIAPQDVINQLMRDGLLFYKDGMYYVNTEQRAYRMPLAMTRRKTIDHSKLKWEPEQANQNNLDPSKLNYYV